LSNSDALFESFWESYRHWVFVAIRLKDSNVPRLQEFVDE